MTKSPATPKAPAHLTAATRAWWTSVLRDYELEAHHLHLLQHACEAWDLSQQARELIARDGPVINGREGGLRPHPAIAIARDSMTTFSRLVRELDLDVASPGAGGQRPPPLPRYRK
jgi:P27 family predicted phage terminase small subunit